MRSCSAATSRGPPRETMQLVRSTPVSIRGNQIGETASGGGSMGVGPLDDEEAAWLRTLPAHVVLGVCFLPRNSTLGHRDRDPGTSGGVCRNAQGVEDSSFGTHHMQRLPLTTGIRQPGQRRTALRDVPRVLGHRRRQRRAQAPGDRRAPRSAAATPWRRVGRGRAARAIAGASRYGDDGVGASGSRGAAARTRRKLRRRGRERGSPPLRGGGNAVDRRRCRQGRGVQARRRPSRHPARSGGGARRAAPRPGRRSAGAGRRLPTTSSSSWG